MAKISISPKGVAFRDTLLLYPKRKKENHMKNPRPMRDAVSRLTDKEYRFIRKEFGITKKELLHLSEDLLIDE